MNTRELILDILLEIEREETYSSLLIRNVLDKYDYLSVKEKAFIKRVTEGTLERRIQLDHIIDAFSRTPVAKMKPLIRNVLRMSVYQLLFMDGVPDSAVCNEAVKLTVKRRFQNLKGFVNGVLRNIARSRQDLLAEGRETVQGRPLYPAMEADPAGALSLRYSIPRSLISMWLNTYGVSETRQMVSTMLEIQPVTIRLKEGLTEKRKLSLKKEMEDSGIEVREHPYLPYAWQLRKLEGVGKMPGFQEGDCTVQDVSSMYCVECAGIRPGDLVVDVCAAPGGKSTHAAEKLQGSGRVLARDISEKKTALIWENRQRMGYNNLEIEEWDAMMPDENLVQKADVVLADLPCSGLGILGKKRDIKYQLTKEMLFQLPCIQKNILDTVWRYVKPGGILMYSTCTIREDENEEIVSWFLEKYPFEPVDLSQELAAVPGGDQGKQGYFQFFPGKHETDGFFLAKFRRLP